MNKRDQKLIHRATIVALQFMVQWTKESYRGEDPAGDGTRANNMNYDVELMHKLVLAGRHDEAVDLAHRIKQDARRPDMRPPGYKVDDAPYEIGHGL